MKETIAWECPACGNRHAWQWDEGDASQGACIMHCDGCGEETPMTLERISADVWVGCWPAWVMGQK